VGIEMAGNGGGQRLRAHQNDLDGCIQSSNGLCRMHEIIERFMLLW
jgi:hypothetical protein